MPCCFALDQITYLYIFEVISFLYYEVDLSIPVFSYIYLISERSEVEPNNIFYNLSDIYLLVSSEEHISDSDIRKIVFIIDFEYFFAHHILSLDSIDEIYTRHM
jgi:hypothetical protein